MYHPAFKILFLVFTILFLSFADLYAQEKVSVDDAQKNEHNNIYIGLGAGQDYGGIGMKFETVPIPFLGIFCGIGYNLQSFAINGGGAIKLLPNESVTPTILMMYGYNGAYKISYGNYNSTGKTFYGPSAGIGVDMKFGKVANKATFGVIYPFRSSEARELMGREAWRVTFSLGMNFSIHYK